MEKEQKHSELKEIKNIKVEEKPKIIQENIFLIVKQKNMYIVAIGNNIISNKQFKTAAEAKKYIKDKPWELIINVAALINNQMQKMAEKPKK